MDWRRTILKLRHEGAWRGGRRVLFRQIRKLENRRRRRRWQHPSAAVSSEAIPDSFSCDAAQRLWPGAADRSWLEAASRRWPELHARASAQAADAASGRFDLLGSGPTSLLDQEGRIRWHDDFKAGVTFPRDTLYLDVPITLEDEGSDIKVPWELSRFQHVFAFLWTNPDRYGKVFVDQWRDWEASNPVGRGVNWACTMDVALRAISWTAALAGWGHTLDYRTLRSVGASLATHGHFIRDNLEWAGDARTNHYFTDIVGLAVLGAVLHHYPPAPSWSEFAARELRREITEQFALDGFSKEGSTAYHRLLVELAILGAAACKVSGQALGETCRTRLLEACRALDILTGASDACPLVGDNDSGRVMPMAARQDADMRYVSALGATVLGAERPGSVCASPELALLCGPAVLEACDASDTGESARSTGCALVDGGLFVLGDARDRVLIRCGPLTYLPVGGHQHLDQLSIAVTVSGRGFIVDSGQYCYSTYPDRRNHYRSTGAHNTVEVDGQSQCRVFTSGRMIYSVIHEAKPCCDAFSVTDTGAYFAGRHGGYRRLRGGGDHERTVTYEAAPGRWIIEDRLALQGPHTCIWRFHLHPGVRAARRGDGWLLERDHVALELRWSSPSPPVGQLEPSTYSPAYGVETSSSVLVFTNSGTGPFEARFELLTMRDGVD